MRLSCLAGQPIDDHRHRVARIIDEQLVACGMVLPHRHRQACSPAPVKIAEAAVAIAVRVTRDIFVPKDLQRHVLALELAMDIGPVGFGAAAVARLRACGPVESGFQNRVGDLIAQRPGQLGSGGASQRLAHRRGRSPHPERDRLVAKAIFKSVSQNLADTPHGHSLRRHLIPFSGQAKEANLNAPADPAHRPETGGRHHLGIRARLILGTGGRDHFGTRGRHPSESAPNCIIDANGSGFCIGPSYHPHADCRWWHRPYARGTGNAATLPTRIAIPHPPDTGTKRKNLP